MNQLDSTEINIALLALGGLVLALGLLSGFLKERLFISDPIVALLVGVLLSPAVFKLIDLTHWGKPESILEQGARLAIAIQLMGVALLLPKGHVFRQWQSLAVLIGPIMVPRPPTAVQMTTSMELAGSNSLGLMIPTCGT